MIVWKIKCALSSCKGADWDWTPPPETGEDVVSSEDATDKHLWLFNLADDPYETTDVSDTATYDDGSSVKDDLLGKLRDYYESSKYQEAFWPSLDETYDPADYGGVWEPWGTDDADVNV